MKKIKKVNEMVEDEYLKDDVVDALQSFDVLLGMMNGDHPTIKFGSEKYNNFVSHMISTYHKEDSRKSITDITNRYED